MSGDGEKTDCGMLCGVIYAMTTIRPLREDDLMEARVIFRSAFGTFVGAPNPAEFWPDREYILTRWNANPDAAVAAELDGRLAGSNFAVNWGSFGYFGPLSVRPELWDRKVGQALIGPVIEIFKKWGVRDAGLFTFPHSAKHVGLYQKFGFWPRFLTAVMTKPAGPVTTQGLKYSTLSDSRKSESLKACRELTNAVHDGLDTTSEIESVERQGLGDTILLWGDSLEAFATCHCGEGTEAGAQSCYVKFGAVRPGPDAARTLIRLLEACETLASERGLASVDAGVNFARSNAYKAMFDSGYRTKFQGVAMHRPNSDAYNRPDAYVIDDWR